MPCGAAQFDVVLGADILYHQEAADVEKLVQTMSSLLAPGGCVLLAYEFRFDWETTRSFYEICAACGLADEQRVGRLHGAQLSAKGLKISEKDMSSTSMISSLSTTFTLCDFLRATAVVPVQWLLRDRSSCVSPAPARHRRLLRASRRLGSAS